jgi:ABC-type polysaccharide/polyol phosphate export permease
VPGRYSIILAVNPLASLLTAWSDVLDKSITPPLHDMLIGLAWAVGLLLAGAAFFISREREFAVRL